MRRRHRLPSPSLTRLTVPRIPYRTTHPYHASRPYQVTRTVPRPLTMPHALSVPRHRIRYVDVMARTPNLACYRRRGLYQIPQPGLVALHYIKKAEGMQFAWNVLHDGAMFEAKACHRIARKWGVNI